MYKELLEKKNYMHTNCTINWHTLSMSEYEEEMVSLKQDAKRTHDRAQEGKAQGKFWQQAPEYYLLDALY